MNDETAVKNVHDGIQLHEQLLQNNYFAGTIRRILFMTIFICKYIYTGLFLI